MRKLTLKEQRLFDLLKQESGRVVLYSELIDILPASGIHTLRQYISRLRQKIEKDPALPDIIITHWGQGYSYEGEE